MFIFFLLYSFPHLYLYSFPTRRSSDLCPLGHVILYSQEYQGTLVARISVLQAACKEGQSLKTTISVLVFVCFADSSFQRDRKSTRLNSSHVSISYAVFCLKKKNKSIHK